MWQPAAQKVQAEEAGDVSETEFLVLFLFLLDEFKGDTSTLSKLGLDSQLRYIVSSRTLLETKWIIGCCRARWRTVMPVLVAHAAAVKARKNLPDEARAIARLKA